jgi:Tfp pilus assembly protein PilE
MSRTSKPTGGFHIVELLIVIVVLAVVGFIGYRVYVGMTPAKTASQPAATTTTVAPIKSPADVQNAAKALDNTTDANLDPSQLDADITSVL